MKHSESLADLATALSKAQGEFESVAKDSTNPFFNSKFAGLPSVVKAATPILGRHGLSVAQLLGHDEQGDTLTTMLLHSSGQYLADTMHLRPAADKAGVVTPQAQGSATTYGRRYAYMAVLGLVADDDDDGNAGTAGTRTRQQRLPAVDDLDGPSQQKINDAVSIAKELLERGILEKRELMTQLKQAGATDKTSVSAAFASLPVDKFEVVVLGLHELLRAEPSDIPNTFDAADPVDQGTLDDALAGKNA